MNLSGIENTPARPMDDDQEITHVHAGTMGRLIRACMKFARAYPNWRASGIVEQLPDRQFRQRMIRRPAPENEQYNCPGPPLNDAQ